MCSKSRLLTILALAGAGVSSTAMAQKIDPTTTNVQSPDGLVHKLPAPVTVDDPAALELANKLGLNRPPMGGLRGVTCDPVGDTNNCHTADLTLGANFSGAAAGAFRTMDNFTPSTSNPTQLCFIGRYANRVNPVANESFQIRIFADVGGFPDLMSGPIFDQTFSQNGTPGVDQLELTCLDSCPGTTDPVAGGHWVFSADLTAGFPVNGNGCYWIEIANVASNAAGVNWGWVGSTGGTDLTSLQAVDGNYTLFTRADGDRSFCFNGGLSPFLGGCTVAPLPPICTNPDANGIAYDGATNFGMRADFPGSVGGFQRAENVSVAANTVVDSICFGGFWLGFVNGAAQGIAPPADPGFRVAYFTNSAAVGVPGAPIPMAEFGVGDPGVTLQWDGDDVANFIHPPVTLPAGECNWVSVGRVQAVQAAGQPVVPIWHWNLTTSAQTHADRRFASRTSGAAPGAWGPTTVTDGGAQGTAISNLWYLLSGGPVIAQTCQSAACQITIPPGVIQENEADCGSLNGGCNNLPESPATFSQINCGDTVRGTVNFDGALRDTDWYQFTLTEQQDVTLEVNAEFAGAAGFIGTGGVPIVNLTCNEPTIAISPFFTTGTCTPGSVTQTLGPGTYTVIVVPDFGNLIDCGSNAGSEYTLRVTCEAPPLPPANDDCASAVLLDTPCTGQDVTVSGTTLGSTADGQLACGTATAQTAGGVWYRVTGNGSAITASACGTVAGYDSQISVYTGSCGNTACVVGDDDACGTVGGMSSVTWNSVDGTDYFILMHGFATSTGNFDLVLSSDATCGGGGCTADWDNSGAVNSNDISAFLTAWLSSLQMGNLIADFNGDSMVNSNDISAFLTAWLGQIGQQC